MNSGLKYYGWCDQAPTEAHSYILTKIVDLLPATQKLKILDAGCGNGYIAGKLSELGHEVIGIDISEDGIEIARNTYPTVIFELCSVYEDLSKISSEVDLVISVEVIEHLYYPQKFLKNIFPIIKPNGWVILTTPYHGFLKNLTLALSNQWDNHFTVNWEGGHIKFFSEKTLSKMLNEIGFHNITFKNSGRIRWFWKSMVCRAEKK